MAYRLQYSDYPGTAEGPPDPARWVGPPGPQGIPGPPGPQGIPGTGFPDAPNDGAIYGRGGSTPAWSGVLPLAGGTLSGALVLSGDASAALNPVTLQQLNTKVGAYLPLAGGTVTGALTASAAGTGLAVTYDATVGGALGVGGTITQSGSRTWTGTTFPGTGNLTHNQFITHAGTVTAGLGGPEGNTAALNLIHWNESLDTLAISPGGAAALEIQHNTTGGKGGRYGLLVSHQVQGNVAAGNNHYYSANFFETSVANVAGAATGNGNGLGQFGALGLYTSMGTTANPVFAHEMQCFEWDFSPSATSTAQFVSGIKLVNFAPSAFTVYGTSAFILMATQNPSTQGGFNVGISFGDVEAADNKGFPISPTGKLITALAGTAGTGVDFSAVTFGSGAFKSSDWNISGGGTAPLLAASAAGVGPPTVTTRSAGTKLVLYPQLAGSQVDFAVGIASSVMWFSVPTATAGQGWQFFGGTSLVAQLGGTGILSVNNSYQVLGSQVAGPRQTGWGAGSNGSRAALNGSTATLAQTSAALAQLIIDLTTHGLIGP